MPASANRDRVHASWIETSAPGFAEVLVTGIGSTEPGTTVLPPGSADWSLLRDEVRTHRLEGLLVHAVATGEIDVDAERRAEVAEIETNLTRSRMWHEAQTVQLITLLDDAGIDTRILKGPALQALDYPDPQMRPTGDLDLLVHGTQIDEACAVLTAAGGERTDPDPIPGYTARAGKGATIAMEQGIEVDLHRLLVWGPFGVRMPPDDLWRAARPFTIAGLPVATLPVEEMLLHAAYHLLVHGWRRALSLRDVVQLAWSPELSTDRLVRLARRWQAEAVLAAAIDLSFSFTGAAAPPDGPVDWAIAYAPSARDRALLRIGRPEAPIGSLDAVTTYLEMQPGERAVFREATLRPEAGTWPSPAQRARRVLDRVQRTWS